jgi:hypothetical protein
LAQPLTQFYEVYYFSLVLIGLWLGLRPATSGTSLTRRRGLLWMVTAYLAFSVPTLIINLMIPATKAAVPSIMCGFAVVFALIIGLKVAPLILKQAPFTTSLPLPKIPSR